MQQVLASYVSPLPHKSSWAAVMSSGLTLLSTDKKMILRGKHDGA